MEESELYTVGSSCSEAVDSSARNNNCDFGKVIVQTTISMSSMLMLQKFRGMPPRKLDAQRLILRERKKSYCCDNMHKVFPVPFFLLHFEMITSLPHLFSSRNPQFVYERVKVHVL